MFHSVISISNKSTENLFKQLPVGRNQSEEIVNNGKKSLQGNARWENIVVKDISPHDLWFQNIHNNERILRLKSKCSDSIFLCFELFYSLNCK